MKYIIGFLCVVGLLSFQQSQSPTLQLALLKYNGGGDWYANPTALTNLAAYSNTNLGTNFQNEYATVEVGDLDIYNFPFLHMTGHGNVVFSDAEAENLRMYLTNGAFLHIDDNYGMDPSEDIRQKALKMGLNLIEYAFLN